MPLSADSLPTFEFCPQCGTVLTEGRCAKCAWQIPSTDERKSSAKNSRRTQKLFAALLAVILLSVGVNLLLNFETMIEWLPSGVLLWMDRKDREEITSELTQRFRNDRLSESQVRDLVAKRLDDSAILIQSPFPAQVKQTISLNHRCALPPGAVYVHLEDWKLLVDGSQVAQPSVDSGNRAKAESSARKKIRKVREDDNHSSTQNLTLPALESGSHRIEITGQLTVRREGEEKDVLYSRPLSLSHDLEIKGEIRDYYIGRSDKSMFNIVRKSWTAIGWWSGDEDDENRDYRLTVWLMIPGTPIVSSVWVRAGINGEYTQVGKVDTSGRHQLMAFSLEFSLAEVPGIEDARRLQVRIIPDYPTIISRKVDECFGGIIEWNKVSITHRKDHFSPFGGDPSLPSRVTSDRSKSKKAERDDDEEL